MFMDCVGNGLLVALVLGVPLTGLALIGGKHRQRTVLIGAFAIVAYWIISIPIMYDEMPAFGFSRIAIYQSFWLWWWGAALMILVIGFAAAQFDDGDAYNSDPPRPTVGSWISLALILVVGFAGFMQWAGGTWNQGRAKALAHQIQAKFEKLGTYPDTDANHILQVPEQVADFKANQALASNTQHNIGTIFKPSKGTLESVDGHLYWLYGLQPSSWKNRNHVIPGYIVTDAENPDASARLRLGYHIRFVPGGYLGQNLSRHLWANGYADKVVGDITLEVDDNWRPFYTASVDKITLMFKPTVPASMLIIDPQTGAIKTHDLDHVPGWVDRVYSADTVKHMLNWWGEWGQANYKLINQSSANRYKVSGNPVLVYAKGGHPVWQAIMTSQNRDTGAAYLALFNARDNVVKLYSPPGLTLEQVASDTILGSPNNLKKNQPVHLSLHRIYGQLTWVAPLIRPAEPGSNDQSSANQGIALLKSDDINGGNVVVADSMAAALTAYRQAIAQGSNTSSPNEAGNTKTADGVVAQLSSDVESGSTVFYFVLGNDLNHVYRAGVSGSSNLELPFIKIGAHIRATYLDTGSTRRDVGSYDDLGLHLRGQ